MNQSFILKIRTLGAQTPDLFHQHACVASQSPRVLIPLAIEEYSLPSTVDSFPLGYRTTDPNLRLGVGACAIWGLRMNTEARRSSPTNRGARRLDVETPSTLGSQAPSTPDTSPFRPFTTFLNRVAE